MAKEKPVEVVQINPLDKDTEEVFFYREDPYVNKVEYAKKGKYKLGPLAEEKADKPQEG